MRIEIVVPALPESVTDATLVSWHHRQGDTVKKDEALLDLETDKVVLEVPATQSGQLVELLQPEGSVVLPGTVLGVIETQSSESSSIGEPPPAAPPKTEAMPHPVVSPAVRRLISEHQIPPELLPSEGRITKQDVLNLIAQRDAPQPAPTGPEGVSPATMTAPRTRRVPMTRIRARIAERMIEAQQTTATLSTFNEVNLDRVFALRNEHKVRFEKRHGVKLGLMSFFVKAAVESLKRHPILNASIDGPDIVYHEDYHIGIAVTTERGLVVPVLRDADRLGYAEIEKAIVDFSLRGKDGLLRYEELAGGTFTITNGGIFGSMLSTPILNPPQSAILGMHAIKDRPVVEEGAIVIRPMIYLALSYDHRIIDGREAVSFLFTIKELLEDPSRLLLDV
jgi:2-oxoglutarate dehydrogenase E2 component (dihydrolipoamide succinyltransferase)